MGFHIYTDGWWRKPENAVTTEATIVEAGKVKRLDTENLRQMAEAMDALNEAAESE